MVIYHNPRCGKSRDALQYLKEKGINPEIRLYLQNPLSSEEIKKLIQKINCKATDLIRKKETLFISEYKNMNLSDIEWTEILAQNPILLERPIIEDKERAAVVRSTEALEAFFYSSQVRK